METVRRFVAFLLFEKLYQQLYQTLERAFQFDLQTP